MVVVTRRRHPLEGQSLRELGRMRRHGRLELLLVLPDGSKSLIPAAWTDLDRAADSTDTDADAVVATLGSLADLLAGVRGGGRPGRAQTASTGTGCREVTVQGGRPCSLSSPV